MHKVVAKFLQVYNLQNSIEQSFNRICYISITKSEYVNLLHSLDPVLLLPLTPFAGSRSTASHYFHGLGYSYCAMGPFAQPSLQCDEHHSRTSAESEAGSSSACNAKDAMTKTAKRFFFVKRFHVLSIPLRTRLDFHVHTLIQDLLGVTVLPAGRATTELALRAQVHSASVADGENFYSVLVLGIFNVAQLTPAELLGRVHDIEMHAKSQARSHFSYEPGQLRFFRCARASKSSLISSGRAKGLLDDSTIFWCRNDYAEGESNRRAIE